MKLCSIINESFQNTTFLGLRNITWNGRSFENVPLGKLIKIDERHIGAIAIFSIYGFIAIFWISVCLNHILGKESLILLGKAMSWRRP